MAHSTQTQNLFSPIDERFNLIILHESHEDMDDLIAHFMDTRSFELLRGIHSRTSVPYFMYPKSYRELVERKLGSASMVHFGGNLPFKGLEGMGLQGLSSKS